MKQPDLFDIFSVVDKFLGDASHRKTSVLLHGELVSPTEFPDALDFLRATDAFLGEPFAEAPVPSSCE